MAVERLIIEVTEKGTRKVSRRIDDVGRSAKKSGDAVGFLKKALATVAVAQLIRQTIRLADSYTNLQNRLRLVTKDQAELNKVTEELFEVSNRTRSAVEINAELFNRLANSAKELGESNKTLLQVTESLNQAVILSGASATEANAALIQLSQGIASGTLRGEELNSVLEQTPVIADVIAKELGVTRGALRSLAQEGKITGATVINAFKNAREELQERFGKTLPTVSQQVTVLRNNIIRFIGRLDQSTKLTTTLGKAIEFLGENIETVSIFAITLLFIPALRGASKALLFLRAAIVANPIGLLATALSAAIGLLIVFKDEIAFSEDGLVSFGDVFSVVFNNIKDSVVGVAGFLIDNLRPVFKSLGQDVDGLGVSFEGFFRLVAKGFDLLTLVPRIVVTSIITIFTKGFSALGELAIDGINFVIREVNRLIRFLQLQINSILESAEVAAAVVAAAAGDPQDFDFGRVALPQIGELKNEFEGSGRELGEALRRGIEISLKEGPAEGLLDSFLQQARLAREERLAAEQVSAPPAPGADADSSVGQQTDALNKQQIAINKVTAALQAESEILQKIGVDREIATKLRRVELQLAQKGVDLSTAENKALRESIEAKVTDNVLRQQAQSILESIRTPEEERLLRLAEIVRLQEAGAITQEQYNAALERYVNQLNTGATAGAAFAKQLQRIDTTAQGLAASFGSAVVGAIGQASDALAEFIINGANDIDALKEAISDILKNLAKQILSTIIQALILRAIVGSQGGGQIGGLLGLFMGNAAGGPVQRNQPTIVGERGPELFVPPSQGNIVPNSQMPQEAPIVNTQIVIVRDPSEITDALETDEAKQIIINTARENQQAIAR